jgi:predicted sulfurtransferase
MNCKSIIEKAIILIPLLFLLSCSTTQQAQKAQSYPPQITKEELKARLSDPAVTVIDVRDNPDWKKSGLKIARAVREDPHEISSWVEKYRKDQELVFYCA